MAGTIGLKLGATLISRIMKLSRKLDVPAEALAVRAMELGLDHAADEASEKRMDEALEPLRRSAKENRGKSWFEVAGGRSPKKRRRRK